MTALSQRVPALSFAPGELKRYYPQNGDLVCQRPDLKWGLVSVVTADRPTGAVAKMATLAVPGGHPVTVAVNGKGEILTTRGWVVSSIKVHQ
jgi:hypothetical protein